MYFFCSEAQKLVVCSIARCCSHFSFSSQQSKMSHDIGKLRFILKQTKPLSIA